MKHELSYLINIEYIRCSIPPPVPRNRSKFALRNLDSLTRTILREQTDHRAGAWPAIQPYGELRGGVSSCNEPKEGVCRISPRDIDPSCVLLLRIENCLAGALRRDFVGDGDTRVDGGNDCGQIRHGRRILSECEGKEKREEEGDIHDRAIMFC
jgi:hypothetical protein